MCAWFCGVALHGGEAPEQQNSFHTVVKSCRKREMGRARWRGRERESEIDAELQLQLIIFLSSLLSLSFIISGLFIM